MDWYYDCGYYGDGDIIIPPEDERDQDDDPNEVAVTNLAYL